MKLHTDIIQGSPQWNELRAVNFTCSTLGPFALEPVKISLTVPELKKALDAYGIGYTSKHLRPDLIALLPYPERLMELCDGARTAILGKIHSTRMLALRKRDPETLTMEERIMLNRENELDAKESRNFEYNIPVKYGKELEPFARSLYESKTGYEVTEVGFIEHDSGGFGYSPDGVVFRDGKPVRIAEFKALLPVNHLGYLLDGVLPAEFEYQCHGGLAVTGLDECDLMLFCPGDAPLLVTVHRNEFTERLESGLKTLVAEKRKMQERLAKLWEAEFMVKTPTLAIA